MDALVIIAQLLCAFTGLFLWRKISFVAIRLLALVVLLSPINDWIIAPHVYVRYWFNRDSAYNVYSLLDMAVWFAILWRLIRDRVDRVLWYLAVGTMLVFTVIELSGYRGPEHFHVDSFRFYELWVMVFAVRYLARVAREEYYRWLTDPFFWLCAVAIVYHAILFLNMTTLAEEQYWICRRAIPVFQVLQGINSILYYLLVSISFVACLYYKPLQDQKAFPGSLPLGG